MVLTLTGSDYVLVLIFTRNLLFPLLLLILTVLLFLLLLPDDDRDPPPAPAPPLLRDPNHTPLCSHPHLAHRLPCISHPPLNLLHYSVTHSLDLRLLYAEAKEELHDPVLRAKREAARRCAGDEVVEGRWGRTKEMWQLFVRGRKKAWMEEMREVGAEDVRALVRWWVEVEERAEGELKRLETEGQDCVGGRLRWGLEMAGGTVWDELEV